MFESLGRAMAALRFIEQRRLAVERLDPGAPFGAHLRHAGRDREALRAFLFGNARLGLDRRTLAGDARALGGYVVGGRRAPSRQRQQQREQRLR
jgi:hypothetical protein